MTAKERERQEAIADLKKYLRRGDEVHLIIRHVSRSGMYRVIAPIILRPRQGRTGHSSSRHCEPLWIQQAVSKTLGWKLDAKQEGVGVGGCGMNMGFHLVYELAYALFGDGYALTHRFL